MSMSRELGRFLVAAALVAVAAIFMGEQEPLLAAEEAGYCIENAHHLCVSTEGGGYVHGYSCDAGACETCTTGGGRCAPFGSGVDLEGWWP